MSPGLAVGWALLLASPSAAQEATPAALLEQAEKMAASMEYEGVAGLAQEALEHPEVSFEQRLRAYVLQARSLAIIGDTTEAEASFRLLLRAEPDYELPADTSPRILALFRKVQAEESALRERLEKLEWARLVDSIRVDGEHPRAATGGLAIRYSYRVTDPFGAVAAIKVHHRRAGQREYSTVALEQEANGEWVGTLAGALTESETAFALEYLVAAVDTENRELVRVGAADSPRSITVAPGRVPEVVVPFYRTAWFWGLIGVVAAGATVGTWLAVDSATDVAPSQLGPIPFE